MEYTKQQIFEMGKELFVSNIVNEILKKDELDNNEITKVELDDHGNILHITFKGAVYASTIIAIGNAFGDNDPNVYGDGDNTINIVVSNEKYECLIGDVC